jgi:hypothetical protein
VDTFCKGNSKRKKGVQEGIMFDKLDYIESCIADYEARIKSDKKLKIEKFTATVVKFIVMKGGSS